MLLTDELEAHKIGEKYFIKLGSHYINENFHEKGCSKSMFSKRKILFKYKELEKIFSFCLTFVSSSDKLVLAGKS